MEKVTKIVVDPKEHTLEPKPVGGVTLPPVTSSKGVGNNALLIFVALLIVSLGLGIGTGFVFAKKGVQSGNSSVSVQSSNSVQTDKEAGINDTSAFPDTATGVLTTGGIRGEGTHHLDRSETKEKEVALSSTVINLDNFVGKKVEIRGQTISSKTSGWLMDVGKIKIVQ